MFVGGFRPRPGPHVFVLHADRRKSEHVRLLRVGGVADVKQRELGARPIKPRAVLVGRTKPDGQQVISREGVNVCGNAGHLEFAQNGRVCFVSDIDHPQRVDLFKRHNVGTVAVKTGAPNTLTRSDAVHLSGFDQHLLVGVHVHRANERHQLG